MTAGEVDLKYATKEELNRVEGRLDRHDTRIVDLERNAQDFAVAFSVLQTKLQLIEDLIRGIGTTVRNTTITIVIGAIVWAIAQSQLGM